MKSFDPIIAVFAGGTSSEREVSLGSGAACASGRCSLGAGKAGCRGQRSARRATLAQRRFPKSISRVRC